MVFKRLMKKSKFGLYKIRVKLELSEFLTKNFRLLGNVNRTKSVKTLINQVFSQKNFAFQGKIKNVETIDFEWAILPFGNGKNDDANLTAYREKKMEILNEFYPLCYRLQTDKKR